LEPFRILQLSDIHFGARSHYGPGLDLRAYQLADEIQACLGDLPTSFDCVVFSGDLTCYGEEMGFRVSQRLAEQFVLRGWMRVEDLLIIPGNHDILFGERSDDAGSYHGPLMREDRESLYRKYYYLMTLRELPGECLGVLKMFPDRKIAIAGLDSCRIESWENAGFGYIGFDQLHREMEDLWERHEQSSAEPWRRLAFVHHHLDVMLWFDQAMATPDWRRSISITLDAEDILKGLAKYGVDFVGHGHMHRPDVREERNVHAGEARIISAGSVAVRASDCGDLHQFYLFELYEGPSPAMRVYDFRRNLQASGSLHWTRREHVLPLLPRRTYSRDFDVWADFRDRKLRAEWNLHLDNRALAHYYLRGGPAQRKKAIEEISRRMRPVWVARGKLHPDQVSLEKALGRVEEYLLSHAPEALKEYESLLGSDDFQAFEQFILQKIEDLGYDTPGPG